MGVDGTIMLLIYLFYFSINDHKIVCKIEKKIECDCLYLYLSELKEKENGSGLWMGGMCESVCEIIRCKR